MTNLLKRARDYDLDVYLGKLLEEGEAPDSYWRKRAGDEAARLSEALGEWPQALEVYRDMTRLKLKPADQLEKKITNVEKHLRAEPKNN